MLIDIHTHNHQPNVPEGSLCFVESLHSLGIHPWKLTSEKTPEEIGEMFRQLQTQLNRKVLAIGECGVDRARESIAPVEFQMQVLEWHMDWATKEKRPLILHCVKAHSDLLMLLKKKRYQGKILLHDYSGNLVEAMKLLDYDAYFSFGHSFFRKQSKTPQVFRELPLERVFLETDDQHDHSLSAIYGKAAEIRRMEQSELEKSLFKNLQTFFGDLNDVSSSDLIAHLS